MPETYTKLMSIDIVRSYEVAAGAGSVQGPVIGTEARYVRLTALGNCRYVVDLNPIASATSTLLPAGMVEYVAVKPGWRVAAIQEGSATSLNVSECE